MDLMNSNLDLGIPIKNDLGFIIEDLLYIYNHENLNPIDIKSIQEIRLMISKDLTSNFIFLTIAIMLLGFLISFKGNSQSLEIILAVVSTLFFIVSIFFKKNSYHILVVTKQYESLLVKLDSPHKKEGIELVDVVQKKLRKAS